MKIPKTIDEAASHTEAVLAFVYDTKTWRDMETSERLEWCRRVALVLDKVTDDRFGAWTQKALAPILGVAQSVLSERLAWSGRVSESGPNQPVYQPRDDYELNRAKRAFSNPDISLDQKAEVVAEAVINDPELMAAINRAQAVKAATRRDESAKRRAADPVGRKFDERIALHELQLETNKYVQKAVGLIPAVGPIPEAERFWLHGEADRLEDVAAELRHMADHGETRADSELRAITEAG